MDIRLENLKKYYPSQNTMIKAVDDISIDIPSNTIYGIIGKSGAGKSSLIRLISLLEKPDAGLVFYGGKEVSSLSEKELVLKRREVGMIFQNFNLFNSRNAFGNVAYPLEINGKSKAFIEKRVKELLDLVGLSGREDAPMSTLSGGQKQRVAIARALANNPGILFCDEATSALDPQTTKSILGLLRDIQKKIGLTIVMITHQMEVVRDVCEWVAVLDEGQVVEKGLVKDIFARPKENITREFLSHMHYTEAEIKEQSEKTLLWSKDEAAFILRFIGEKTGEPILSKISKKTNVDFNIRGASVAHLLDEEVGTLYVDMLGSEVEISEAIQLLKTEGVQIENTKGEIL
ncbi:MAG TPA: phosphate ABC transporter ATP-binding protein [Treponema sp.]|nr:phosphate ABC transporter ATP-binding protein [Treponema sp.]